MSSSPLPLEEGFYESLVQLIVAIVYSHRTENGVFLPISTREVIRRVHKKITHLEVYSLWGWRHPTSETIARVLRTCVDEKLNWGSRRVAPLMRVDRDRYLPSWRRFDGTEAEKLREYVKRDSDSLESFLNE